MKYIPRLAGKSFEKMLAGPKVVMVLGARQVGKTTLIKQITKNKKTLFFNLDIEIDKQRFLASATLPPQDVPNALQNPQILVVDEAQRLPEAARIIKGWYDAQIPIKMVLLGSSSLNYWTNRPKV